MVPYLPIGSYRREQPSIGGETERARHRLPPRELEQIRVQFGLEAHVPRVLEIQARPGPVLQHAGSVGRDGGVEWHVVLEEGGILVVTE